MTDTTINEVAAFSRGAESVRAEARNLLALGAGRLTPEDVAKLRRPFAREAVKWLPIGKPTSNRTMGFMPHIDASLVTERLSDVDPCWTHDTQPLLAKLGLASAQDPFGSLHGSPWTSAITLKGVTRSDIGQLDAGAKPDNKHLKSGHSDAIKRAAWEFGVGAYLRAIPVVYLPETGEGGKLWWSKDNGAKFGGLNPAGTKALRGKYKDIVEHERFIAHYGQVESYGDLEEVLEQTDEVAPATSSSGGDDGVNTDQLEVLVALAKHTGRDTPEDVVRATLASTTFAKALANVLNSLKSALLLDAEDAERLRVDAIAAAEGDEARMTALVDGLDQLAAIAETKA